MECNCNNNNSNGGVIPWVRGNRLPLIICVYENVVTQEQVGDSTLTVNEMTRVPYEIQDNDTVTVIMKSGFRQVAMPFTTDGNKVMVTDNGELPTGAYTVEVTIERGDGARGRWQETRQVRIYENTSDAQLGEMYSIDADLFFYAKGDTGTGIADITNNPDGTLTITMTDGTSYVTEALKGDKGDKGDTGERGVSIVAFDVTGQTDVSVIYTVTFSDDTTQEVAVPKGPQGDTGLTGNGISTTTLNSDYTLTIAYTDGTTYTTPSIRGAQGAQGVSVIGFTQTGETATNTMYNLVFSDGRTQSVAIPKGVKGDKGDAGNPGPQGAQGPKGDTVTATDYTLYNVQGSDSQGAMSQDATTKAISAQTGYYTCGAAADKVDKVAAVENGNLYKRTLGGHFKVKMTNANTASGVTLQVGSETATTLWYNGAAVSADNSWDAGEVISVYYDGTYYQASNAQGGGSSVGKKRIIGGVGFINTTNVATQGQIPTPTRTNTNYNCIKYPVNAGDVLQITGRGGGNTASLLYAFGDIHNDYISGSSTTIIAKDLVLVVPEGAVWVVLNSSIINGNTYEWYHAKARSMGAHEIFTECYIYGDLETLALGQTYEAGTAIKTTDKQLRRTTKEIKDLSLSEALAIGDVRIIDNTTYRAASAVNTFNPNTTYAEGAYALGSMTVYTLTITADNITAGNITVNGTKVAIEATDDAAAIATKISAALSINGWFDTINSNVITVICNTIGNNTTTITITDTDNTGVVVEGVSTPSVEGTNTIRKYDGSDWEDATTEGMIEDEVLVIADEEWLIANASSQNSVTKDIQGVKENEVEEKVENINNHPDLILERQPVDLTLYPEQDCSLGGRNDKWYYNGSTYGKHKAIEVSSGEIIGINLINFANGFYGWMNSNYNPPYQNGSSIPYLYNGTGSRHPLSKSDELQYLTVPEGAKYLVICTVDGGGNRVNWEVVKWGSEYRHSNFVKLRVAHWNIGHFAIGSGSSTSITPENYDEMSAKYKQVVNDLGADIFGFAEYDPIFCTDGKLAKDVIFQCYSNIYEGTKPDYNCNTIMFNGLKHISDRQVFYTVHTQHRYMKIVDVLINGRPVRIVETHWDFNSAANKRSQATQLLNLVKDFQYVIIGGDLNTYDTSQSHAHKEEDAITLQMFKDAGFEFVNNGYLDPFTTATDGGSVDHIMTKGFAMSNRQRVDASGTLSDHYAICCDLVMKI